MIIRNARLVLGAEVITGSLIVEDGRIAAIDSGGTMATDAIDFDGDYLLPGLVEVHTDNLEKHLMPRPKVRWPALPAILAHDQQLAGAGITTVLDAIAVGDIDHESVRIETLQESLAALAHAGREGWLRADHFLHLRCEVAVPNVLELFAPIARDPRVRLVSLMDHTPGQRQWTDLSHYRTYVTGKKGWSEAKVDAMLDELSVAQRRFADRHRAAIIDLCREHHLPLATHDDTTVEHVIAAHDEGVTMAEFPTTRAATEAAHRHGMAIIMGAPNVVRGGSHSGNIAAIELARLGLIDVLSSDYVPASLLHAALLLVDDAGFSLPQAIGAVTATPAKIVGLADRGELAIGKRADFIRVKRVAFAGANSPVVVATWKLGQRIA